MAITLVDSTSIQPGGTTPAIDTTGATLLVAVTGSTGVTTTISDSLGNAWSRVLLADDPSNATLQVFVAQRAIVGAGHTFTVANSFPSLCVAAFAGVEALDIVLGFNFTEAAATVESLATGSVTPAAVQSLVVAALAYRTTVAVAIDSGFAILENEQFASGSAVGTALAYKIVPSGAVNPTWSWTGASGANAAALTGQPASPSAGTTVPFGWMSQAPAILGG